LPGSRASNVRMARLARLLGSAAVDVPSRVDNRSSVSASLAGTKGAAKLAPASKTHSAVVAATQALEVLTRQDCELIIDKKNSVVYGENAPHARKRYLRA
jgi:hypothetical protein